MLKNLPAGKVFCIGIGGIGLSGLAELMHKNGIIVAGSDPAINAQTKRLQSLGVTVFDYHEAKNIDGAELVVYSSAVKTDNPERCAAVKNNIRLITRGQLLAEVMQSYCGINVAGTHGKTTTSGLIAWVFEYAKKDPTFMIGGVLSDRHSPMQLGQSSFFIAESDESDATFLLLSSTVGVITNIDADHMETYDHNFENLKKSFLQFANNIHDDGFAVVCIDDPVIRALIPQIKCRIITYGESDDADYQLKNFSQNGLRSTFTVTTPQQKNIKIPLNLAGKHNALNALAAIIIAHEYHLSDVDIQNALNTFPGMKRRLQPHGEMNVVGGRALLFDDYGHHPVELKATLQAAKLAFPNHRIVLVFQPHRYTRTRDLLTDFADVLKSADQLVLTEVYAASEQKIEGADGQALFNAVKKAGMQHVYFVPELSALPSELQKTLKPNDIVILQGAGNIVTMVDMLLV